MIVNWRLIKDLAETGVEIDKSLLDLVKCWEDIVTWAENTGFTEDNCRDAYKAVMATNPVRDIRHIFGEMRKNLASTL